MTWFIEWFSTMDMMKAVGILGQVLFGSRFFVQWAASERIGRSVIPVAFWYLSLFGGALTLVYAIKIQEPVFMVPQIGGLIIYARNLYFIYRDRRRAHPLMGPDRA
jgi:lipid-A-disaccharide synthase-like uncharacterized protein